MNFKRISNHFGTRVHVWGCCGYINHKNQKIKAFIPAKDLEAIRHVAKRILIVAQNFSNMEEFFTDYFKPEEIFPDHLA